jgi:hypothetical protein
MSQTQPKPQPHEPCPLIRGCRSGRRANLVIETGAGVPGPWCVIRDALSLVSCVRNTGLGSRVTDHGVL